MHQIDIATVDLNLLGAFEVLNEERHVGRAAKRLRLSQSAASHALGRLRRLFDDPLFVRHPRGVEPTRRARELAAPIANALAEIRHLLRPVPGFAPATLECEFRLTAHDYAMAVAIAPLVALLREEAPRVDLRCRTLPKGDVVAALDRGEIDVALGGFVGIRAERIERIERIPLFVDRFVGIARKTHPLLRRRPSRDRFVGFPQVMVGSDGDDGSEIYGSKTKARIAVTASSFLAVPAIVESSDLVGILPARLAQQLSPALGVFPLPVATRPLVCHALVPRPLATRPDMAWLLARMKDVMR